MKNSKEYSARIKRLYRTLKQKHGKVTKLDYDNPIDSLIYAIVNEHLANSPAQAVIKKLRDHFVDWNDLRVAQREEIVDIFAKDAVAIKEIAASLNLVLNSVFEKYNMLNLDDLLKTGKRPAKQILEKFSGISAFVVNYVFMTSLQGHAIPLNDKMIEYLRGNNFVYAKADVDDIEGFLSRQVSSSNGFEFYYLLRKDSESYKPIKKKKAVKAKPVIKTTKKKVSKVKKSKVSKKKTAKKKTAKKTKKK